MARKSFTKDQVLSSLCRDSFYDFVRTFWSTVVPETPVWNWHIEYLCGELQSAAERVFRGIPKEYDLLINVSPGTSKSSIASVMFPAWVWVRMPSARCICASYAHSLAMDLARKSRDVIKSDLYGQLFPEVKIREDADTRAAFVNTAGGARYSVGVNGSVTGLHAHFLIVDDPLDPNQAMSEAELKNADNWMRHTLPSRKVDKSVSLTAVVMQRLHALDPSGMMLEEAAKGGTPVRHVCLPARLPPEEHNNVYPVELRAHYAGGLFDPIRMPESVLSQFESRSAYAFHGQFMQSPTPLGGGMFRAEFFNQRVRAAPYTAQRIRYWDHASATSVQSCWTVGTLIAKTEDAFYVEDVVRGRWEPLQRNNVIRATALRDRMRYGPGRNEPMIYMERQPGSAGVDAWKGVARALAGFAVYQDSVTGDKEVRAMPWAAQLAAHNVYVVDNGESTQTGTASWDIQAWIDEHVAFPNGKWLDQVDSCSGAFNLLAGRRRLTNVLRTVAIRHRNQSQVRVVVCPPDRLSAVELFDRAVLVWFRDPAPVVQTSNSLVASKDNLALVADSTTIQFADVCPQESQESYLDPLPDGSTVESSMMTPEHGRALWSFLRRPRTYGWTTLVLADDRRRGLACARAFCEVLRLDPEKCLEVVPPEGEEGEEELPENRHVYRTVKSSSNSVRS